MISPDRVEVAPAGRVRAAGSPIGSVTHGECHAADYPTQPYNADSERVVPLDGRDAAVAQIIQLVVVWGRLARPCCAMLKLKSSVASAWRRR